MVLITGAAGFTGRYMCEYIRSLSRDIVIAGVDIRAAQEHQCDDFFEADITSTHQINHILKKIKPGYIIHLAGTFGTGDMQQVYKINVLSITAILEAVLEYVPDSIVVTSGSAAEYGNIDLPYLPVTEQNACNPVTPYGLSKNLATQIAQYYHQVHSLRTMIVRPFQLIGKGVSTRLAPGAFAERLIEAKLTGRDEILVGNLESSRDFLNVQDAVRAIWLLCKNPLPGEIFNLCSGRSIKLRDLVEMMIKLLDGEVKPVTDKRYLLGDSDVDVVYGSFQKIQTHCGWKPEISLHNSLASMLKTN